MVNKRKIIELSESESFETESEGVVEISSSTSDDEDDGNDSDSVEEDDDGDEDYDSEDDYDDEDSELSEDEAEKNVYVDMNDEQSVCSRVIRFLRDKHSIESLKWNECKVFLRKHGLRLAGTKEECMERIKEFWRLKDGNGESFYPRSSFAINCTGDVCQGDVVLFHQKVYDKFSKMKRRGSVLGIRTVAGRIVKDSYGAAKQQHTFTVEVLWSRGMKALAPLVPLLVKGRILYRMKTFRQRWKNENKRLEVLAEKHQRGAAARTVRDVRRAKMATKMNKSTTSKGAKRCKVSRHSSPSGAKVSNNAKTCVKKQGKALIVNKKSDSL